MIETVLSGFFFKVSPTKRCEESGSLPLYVLNSILIRGIFLQSVKYTSDKANVKMFCLGLLKERLCLPHKVNHK